MHHVLRCSSVSSRYDWLEVGLVERVESVWSLERFTGLHREDAYVLQKEFGHSFKARSFRFRIIK